MIMSTNGLASSNRISSALLFLTVAAAPFPFGSTAPVVVAFWCIILGVAAAALSLKRLRPEHLPLVGLALILTLAYAFVLHEQLAARPWIASPHPLWKAAADAMGAQVAPSASIARNEPFLALGPPLANLLSITCSFVICIESARVRQLLRVVAWSGAGYALYGIAAYLIQPTHILWREAPPLRNLSSTFENRNIAAVYFGVCAVLWLLFSLERLRQRAPIDGVFRSRSPRLLLFEFPGLSVVMLVVCLAAMVMTASRAGTVLSIGAVFLAAYGFFYRDLKRRRFLAAGLLVGAVAAFALFELIAVDVVERFQIQGIGDPRRADVYRSILRMIADRPWFGTGLGTFVWSFPLYRSDFMMLGIWTFAHSTFLELVSDLGIPLVGIITLAWCSASIVLVQGVRRRRRNRIVPAAALAVLGLYIAHSFIDFAEQIPGYAIVVFALVGAGLAQSFSSSPGQWRASREDELASRESRRSRSGTQTGNEQYA